MEDVLSADNKHAVCSRDVCIESVKQEPFSCFTGYKSAHVSRASLSGNFTMYFNTVVPEKRTEQ